MEPNLPVIAAKKLWHMLRVAVFLLRKGILKSNKLIADLNFMMKRGKIAGKAIHNLMFHHWAATNNRRHLQDYEFSCSNTPAHPNIHFPTFHFNKRSKNRFLVAGGGAHHKRHQSPEVLEDNEWVTANALMKALEMLQSTETAASPALPGFGRSPTSVRQLRITDSPFPLNYAGDDDDNYHVDEAAENFIKKFYKDLRNQHAIAAY